MNQNENIFFPKKKKQIIKLNIFQIIIFGIILIITATTFFRSNKNSIDTNNTDQKIIKFIRISTQLSKNFRKITKKRKLDLILDNLSNLFKDDNELPNKNDKLTQNIQIEYCNKENNCINSILSPVSYFYEKLDLSERKSLKASDISFTKDSKICFADKSIELIIEHNFELKQGIKTAMISNISSIDNNDKIFLNLYIVKRNNNKIHLFQIFQSKVHKLSNENLEFLNSLNLNIPTTKFDNILIEIKKSNENEFCFDEIGIYK